MDKEILQKKLSALNREVEIAIKKRTIFLDENMKHYAEFQIDEEVLNIRTLEFTVVTEHYRFHKNKPEYDNAFSVDCRFKNGDNTSRYAGLHPYIRKSDYIEKNRNYIMALERNSRIRYNI